MTKIRFLPKYFAGIIPSQPEIRALVVIKSTPSLILKGKLLSFFIILSKIVLAKIITGPIAES